jgi:ubiquinone/menaquinone biosynthesis C-methylase UbiE
MPTNVFNDMGKYWQEIADKGPTKQQIQFIKNNINNSPQNWILDLGCGTGRHTIPLTKEGYNIIGIDTATTLLKIAKQHTPQIHLIKADIQHLPFKEKTFTTALSIDNSFSYLPNEEAEIKSLKQLQKTLHKNATLIIDVFNYEQLKTKYPPHNIKNLKWLPLNTLIKHPNKLTQHLLTFYTWQPYTNFYLLQKRTLNIKTQQLSDLWITKNKTNKNTHTFHHTTHIYKQKHLQNILSKTGFNTTHIYGNYTNQNFNKKSTRLIIIAKTTTTKHNITNK